MRKQFSFRALALLLVLSLLVTLGNEGLLSLGNTTVLVKASGDASAGGIGSYITYDGTVDPETFGNAPEEQEVPVGQDAQDGQPSEDSQADEEAVRKLYADGMIHLYNFRQLNLVGTDVPLTVGDDKEENVGSGSQITDDDGKPVIYSSESAYFLEGDITLPEGTAWSLPADFTGVFTSAERSAKDAPDNGDDAEKTEDDGGSGDTADPGDEESPGAGARSKRLYDVESDTVYIQNICQLCTLADSNRANIPVMTGDVDAETFGTGQFVYPDDESERWMTYSADHNYVISSEFTTEQPAQLSIAVDEASPLVAYADPEIDHQDGRDFAGQVTVNIGGTDYILIGSAQQLQALSTGEDKVKVYGAIYRKVETRQSATGLLGEDTTWHTQSDTLIYPGDADVDSDGVLYDGNYDDSIFSSGNEYPKLGSDLSIDLLTRTTVYTVDPTTGVPSDSLTSNPIDMKYSRSGNYIVFRDISLNFKDWTPMRFDGLMYGMKQTPKQNPEDPDPPPLFADKTELNIDTRVKPTISQIKVVPTSTVENNIVKLNTTDQMGVGFFSTISGRNDNTNFITYKSVVKNIALSNGTVENHCTESKVDQTAVSLLLEGVGFLAEFGLNGILSGLIGKDIDAGTSVKNLLLVREQDPSGLATGAFAGRIIGDVEVSDCSVSGITVTADKTKFENDENHMVVGMGGFVGYVEGTFKYDGLSNLLGVATDGLTRLLNLIPGVGLGDLIELLLNDTVATGNLIPTGYNTPGISNCTATGCSLVINENKYGVGGFAGSISGSEMTGCKVIGATLNIKAERFGGGFAGVERDEIIKATLGDLGIKIGSIYPQSEMIGCSVEGCSLNISGGSCLGGFAGIQANSYIIDSYVDASTPVTISASGDCIGGFTGSAQLGSTYGMENYLFLNNSLLTAVKRVATDLLADGGDLDLLELGGISNSAILGCGVGGRLEITTTGSQVGGILGYGNGVTIDNSNAVTDLFKYRQRTNAQGEDISVPAPAVNGADIVISKLVKVHAEDSEHPERECNLAGGCVGNIVSANAGTLLTSTTGLKAHLGFRLANVSVYGTTEINGAHEGYTVEASGNFAGGATGFAIGGDITNVQLYNLQHVRAKNHVGGFSGMTGPDKVSDANGLDLTLLGISLLKIDNLLNITDGVHTNLTNSNVNGISSGFTVEATGKYSETTPPGSTDYNAGGFAGDTTSVTMNDCHVRNLLSVTSDMRCGKSGGFVGYCAAGDLSGINAEGQGNNSLIGVGQLIELQSDIIPKMEKCDVTFVQNGFVKGNAAGGFTGEFRSGTLNVQGVTDNNTLEELKASPYAVYNIDHVEGGKFAGGFGGKVFSGALDRNGGSGLSLIGDNAKIDVGGIESITNAYIPKIYYGGVKSEDGFTVLAAYIESNDAPATKGFAGGYIGYGSGMEISHCDVRSLKHCELEVDGDLEAKNRSEYVTFLRGCANTLYSVAGAEYAGGYIGYMNVGSARALGDSIKLLGEDIRTTGLLRGLEMVVTTIEHSDVYGLPGGFSVLASSHVNLGDENFDQKGVGYSGGFAGRMAGAHVQDSSSYNFSYIIGEVASGGYAGEMCPGNVADVLDYDEEKDGLLSTVLGGVLDTDDMISVVQAFVPTVYNSCTTCIPCGGVVRAQSFSDVASAVNQGEQQEIPLQRGFAGGFVGHSIGGQIWGKSDAAWMGETNYSGLQRNCDAVRIRSIYGAEYAGGYAGLMEAGSTAKGGSLSLLGGVISAQNIVKALPLVYPTIENANVYGPLEKINVKTWNKWIEKVGYENSFVPELKKIGKFTESENPEEAQQQQALLEEALSHFIYGYHVVAGRDTFNSSVTTYLSGCAGGYAGAMHSGVIRNGTANNAKQVRAMRAAGGYVGEIQTKGLAEFGSVNILGLDLKLGDMVDLTKVLVPVIFESGVTGYQKGLIVRAEGLPKAPQNDSANADIVKTEGGMAGGFAGACYGAQIGTRGDGRIDFEVQLPEKGAWVKNLKTVNGSNCVGGFAGKTSAASVVNADDSDSSNGLIQKLLDNLITNPSQLVDVLDATITVIGKAETSALPDSEWGFVVDGEYKENPEDSETRYASCAGGFVGSAEATVFGARNTEQRTLNVNGLRGVSGGHYSGGFFGLAQVGSVAQVGDSGSNTTVLNLIQAGNFSLLDIFRTYIYHAKVTGIPDGIRIYASDMAASGKQKTYLLSGSAGGFGGALMNGTVENSSVTGLNAVQAPNYAGGFIGISGTSGGIGLDEVSAHNDENQNALLTGLGLNNLGLDAQLLNVIGSTLTNCDVTGYVNGFIARTFNIQTTNESVSQEYLKGSCAAGFAGFAEMAQIEECRVDQLKYVQSPQVAGGFIGKTDLNYLVEAQVGSELTDAVLKVVNLLLKALYAEQLENIDLVNLDPNHDSSLAGLRVLSEGDLLYVNLMGLKIGVALEKSNQDGVKDTAIITLGSSTVRLPCDEENGVEAGDNTTQAISVTLIEGNRTNADKCNVVGIADYVYDDNLKEYVIKNAYGYDVFAGGADETRDGDDPLGYAGGFIGYNTAGRITECYTDLCDLIRGTHSKVGPFTGYSDDRSRGTEMLEGENNKYSIYRSAEGDYRKAVTNASPEEVIGTSDGALTPVNCENCVRYEATHLTPISTHDNFINAAEVSESTGNSTRALDAYVSPSAEVLMLNVPLDDNGLGDTPVTNDLKDPCDDEINLSLSKVWKDFLFLDSRPDRITVRIAQVQVGSDKPDCLIKTGSPETGSNVNWFTMDLVSPDGRKWSTTWNATVKMPAAVKQADSESVIYYQYYVAEVELENYRVSYEIDQSTATVEITNRYTGPLLPQTGGTGVLMFYGAGMFLVIGGVMLLIFRRKNNAQKKAMRLGTSDVELDPSNFSDFLKYLKK